MDSWMGSSSLNVFWILLMSARLFYYRKDLLILRGKAHSLKIKLTLNYAYNYTFSWCIESSNIFHLFSHKIEFSYYLKEEICIILLNGTDSWTESVLLIQIMVKTETYILHTNMSAFKFSDACLWEH